MVISALMPERSGGLPSTSSNCRRTGTRCTTLTQLPLAFCGGISAYSEPVAGLRLRTRARQVTPG